MNTKRRTGRLLGVLLCLVMLLELLPVTAQAYYEFEVPNGTAYVDLYIDGGKTYYRQSDNDSNLNWVRLFDGYCLPSNTEPKTTKYTAGGSYVARVESGTLYLNGYHGKTTSFSSYGAAEKACGIDMTPYGSTINKICVEQDSSVTISVTNKEAYGIWGGRDLTITGTGKLTVNAIGANGYSRGISTSGSLTVSAPLDVTAEMYGLYTNQLTLNGSTDKTVTVTGAANTTVYGVYLNSVSDGDHTISGSLTVNLPTDTEALGTGYGVGIGVPTRSGNAAVNLTGAEVTITNGQYGIYDSSAATSDGARVVMSGSTLNITSTGVYGNCYGIKTTYNGLEITNGSTVNINTNGIPISILSDTAGVTIRNSNATLTNTIGTGVIGLQTSTTNTTSMNVIDLAEGYTVTLKGGGSLTGVGSMVSRVKLGDSTCATTFLSREADSKAPGSYRYVGVKEGDYAVVRFAHGEEVFPPEASLKALYTSESGKLGSAEISKSATTAFTHQLPLELEIGLTDLKSFSFAKGYYCLLGKDETIAPATEWTEMTKGKYIVLGEEVSTQYDNYARVYVRYQYRAFNESTLRWSSPKQVGIFKYVPLDELTPVPTYYETDSRCVIDTANKTIKISGTDTSNVDVRILWPSNTGLGSLLGTAVIKMYRYDQSGMGLYPLNATSVYVTPQSGTKNLYLAAKVKAVTIDNVKLIEEATSRSVGYTITCPDIKATYKLTLKNCTATVNGVEVTSGSKVEEGATVTVTATLTGNYKLNYWSVTGNPSLPNENTVTFTMPGKDTTAEAILYDASEIVWWPKVPMKNTRSANEFGDIKLEDIDGEPSKNENTELAVVWYDESGKKVSESDAIDRTKNYRGHVTVTCTGNYVFEKSATLKKFVVTLYTDINGVTDALNEDQYTVSADKKTLGFDVYLINLPQVTIPLYQGEALPAAGDCTVSGGCTIKSLTWSTTGTAGTSATISELKLERANGTLWGKATMTLSVNNGDPQTVTNSGSYLTLANTNLPAPERPTGVSVSGTALSWNSTDDATYVLYPASMSDAAIKAEWKAGGSFSGTVCGSKSVPTASGKQYAQTFTFDTVAAGDYKLVIVKPGHGLWIEELTVSTDNITDKSIRLYKMGDVNRDGKVNSTDALWVRQSSAGGRVLDAYQKILADLNRDGKVNSTDALWIRQISAGSRTLTY